MSKQAAYDASNEVQVKKAKKSAADLAQEKINDMIWLMGDPRGRRIVYRYLSKAGIWTTSFTGNSKTFFNEGQRNMGLMLLDEVTTACVDEYTLMMKENKR